MTRTPDLIGRRFGKFIVLSRNDHPSKPTWTCRCDCGNERRVTTHELTTGKRRACGCLRDGHPTHGETGTPLYGVWQAMRRRCYYEKEKRFADYGGRGIRVCPEWRHYVPFRDWALKAGYGPGLEIDRIDVNGHYEPANCRFVTRLENARNKRSTMRIFAFGREWRVKEAAAAFGMHPATLRFRIHRGLDHETALTRRLYAEPARGR